MTGAEAAKIEKMKIRVPKMRNAPWVCTRRSVLVRVTVVPVPVFEDELPEFFPHHRRDDEKELEFYALSAEFQRDWDGVDRGDAGLVSVASEEATNASLESEQPEFAPGVRRELFEFRSRNRNELPVFLGCPIRASAILAGADDLIESFEDAYVHDIAHLCVFSEEFSRFSPIVDAFGKDVAYFPIDRLPTIVPKQHIQVGVGGKVAPRLLGVVRELVHVRLEGA